MIIFITNYVEKSGQWRRVIFKELMPPSRSVETCTDNSSIYAPSPSFGPDLLTVCFCLVFYSAIYSNVYQKRSDSGTSIFKSELWKDYSELWFKILFLTFFEPVLSRELNEKSVWTMKLTTTWQWSGKGLSFWLYFATKPKKLSENPCFQTFPRLPVFCHG